MSARVPKPSPIWLTVPALLLHTVGMFVLPFAVGFVAALLLEVTEVAETGRAMNLITLGLLLPVALAHALGLLIKSRRDLAFYRKSGDIGAARVFDVLAAHARVITGRGWSLLGVGLLLIVVSLAARWAEFGIMTTLALFLFYGMTGWTVFVSTFLLGRFERGAGTSVGRRMVPTVAQAGEPVEEVFTFHKVPIPWGYLLIVEDPGDPRLRTESRYVVGAEARGAAEVRGRLRATPRGHYFLGPARMAYQDILGITRVRLPAMASAQLKLLPPFRPVEVVEPPKSPQQTPDIITKPNRFPTEDYFRFREYAGGDDTRRIHWRLSVRTGQMQVRVPETREITTQEVLLALDTWLPARQAGDAGLVADEILDALVEAWLGIARSLVERGDRVTLCAAVSGHEKDEIAIERVRCVKGEGARWQDLGARARWQSQWDVPRLLEEAGKATHGVVVTGRFTRAPEGALPGQTISWLFLDPADALNTPEAPWMSQVVGGTGPLSVLNWMIRLPHPAGSEENALLSRLRDTASIYARWEARKNLRSAAIKRAGATLNELKARGDAIYRIERKPNRIRLVGLSAGKSSAGKITA